MQINAQAMSPRAIQFEWEDSASTSGWHDPHDSGLCKIKSIGWLIRETKRTVTISTSISDSGKAVDQITIPRSNIRKMKRVSIK